MNANWLYSYVFAAVVVGFVTGARARIAAANDIQNFTRKTSDEPSKTVELKIDLRPINERFPHAVLYGGTCGGTIISPSWVLTAAHCTLEKGRRRVLAGTGFMGDWKAVLRSSKREVVHPLFSVGPYWLNVNDFNITQVAARWDFLLVELSEPLPLDDKTMVAAKLDDQPSLPVGLNVSYAGYGASHLGGYIRSEMHEMDLAVQSDDVCKTLEQFNPEDMLCAKGRYDSACNGDSGSGLVDKNGRLVGIVSWAEKDARACLPGTLVVFSRVSSVREWIRQVTNI